MNLDEAVKLVETAFENANSGDLWVQKSPASSISDLTVAIKELFGVPDYPVKTIDIRHGEKMYETLLTDEECSHSTDEGNFYRVSIDKRDLNYDKYFVGEPKSDSLIEEYNSNNTVQLNVEQIKEKLLSLEYIRNELLLWNKIK
jgi:UDP-glucose 4-epimerase